MDLEKDEQQLLQQKLPWEHMHKQKRKIIHRYLHNEMEASQFI